MSIGQIITIVSWVIQKYENVKKFIKDKYHIYRSRKIREAVDNRDADSIESRVRDVLKKRQDRQDSD